MKRIASAFIAFIIVVLFFACQKTGSNPSDNGDGDPTTDPKPPVAAFSMSTASGDAPVSINFTDKSTGSATSWSWDFGDGYTSAEQNPSHTYARLGRYTVKLTVSNADGSNLKTWSNAITVYEIKVYTKESIGPFYPKRTYGDAEFDGNGPYVKLTADLLRPAGGVAGGSEPLMLKLTMYAKETQSDWSTAYGEWTVTIASLPTNAVVKDFLTSPGCWQNYTDNGHGYVYSSGLQLGDFWSVGDTDGDDICSSGCGSSSTHLYFKNFYCKVRIQPK